MAAGVHLIMWRWADAQLLSRKAVQKCKSK
nr:MAG TPA: hypothetical protein [Caudoviricetes sp.]